MRKKITKIFRRVRHTVTPRFFGSALALCVLIIGGVVFRHDIAQFLGIERARAAVEYKMQTGYFVGDGGSQDISGLGFRPDMVIVKADTTAGVGAFMKTSVMPANNTAYLSGAATANDTANAIELTAD
ncbi:MAG: hypothetical protein KBD21_04625, partial [Candidatus Pacebacteria bacterium]|nr:hypothetical protein [Candidatus Paceibacterota bacterium]